MNVEATILLHIQTTFRLIFTSVCWVPTPKTPLYPRRHVTKGGEMDEMCESNDGWRLGRCWTTDSKTDEDG